LFKTGVTALNKQVKESDVDLIQLN
jgi:hypothetical protein